MKPFLLYKVYEDKNPGKGLNEDELTEDLNLSVIFQAMSQKDKFLHSTVRSIVLNSLTDISTLIYRQKVLQDCLANKAVTGRLYSIATDALNEAADYVQNMQPSYSKIISTSTKLMNSVALFESLIVKLEKLRAISRQAENNFHSEGFSRFFNQQASYLTDEFFMNLEQHISDLKYLSEGGRIIIGSGIGTGMKGKGHILRRISRYTSRENSEKKVKKSAAGNEIPLDNNRLANSAREMEDAALIHILRLINYFNSSMLNYFQLLRYETGFYLGCANLHTSLSEINVPVTFPVPERISNRSLMFDGLYDVSLALSEKKKPVGNALKACEKTLLVITGANQGGKTTFLRSIGIAQLFMQCGMFVPSAYFAANVCDRIFTHFTREEDACMNSGKLDEELLRMSSIIDLISVDSMLLVNEPLATTTEREGSEIASEIVTALYEIGVKVLLVTHLFEFSEHMCHLNLPKALFLRAERSEDGSRTFCIKPGCPLHTSYGEDLFNNIVHLDDKR
jgi:DNA mismatch repair ATPase MutS